MTCKRVSGKNMLIRSYMMIGVNDPNPPPGEYLPAIRSTVNMNDLIDPRGNVTVEIEIENQNRRIISEMDVRLRSHMINADHKTSLGPLEQKKITINVPVDPLTNPQEDVLRVMILTSAGERIYQYEAEPFVFQIMHYGGIVESHDEKKSFLKKTTTITLTNEGNGDIIDVYKMQKGFFERFFMSFEPGFERFQEDGENYLGWTLNLAPYESMEIRMVTSHRVPFGIIVLIIAAIVFYYLLRSPVVVHKSATVLSTKEGGISELKVLIILKNRSPKPVKGVTVIDKVSHIADVLREFEMGTLHPTKVFRHDKKGTLIKWEVKELDRFEERVLAYKIKSRLSVLGDFRLPVAVVKYKAVSGKEKSTHSNSVTLIGA